MKANLINSCGSVVCLGSSFKALDRDVGSDEVTTSEIATAGLTSIARVLDQATLLIFLASICSVDNTLEQMLLQPAAVSGP